MTTIDAKKIGLLPCPFCGGAAQAEHFESKLGRWRWSIGCNDHKPEAEDGGAPVRECYGFQSMTSFATKAEAITAWNRRAALSVAGEDVEGLCKRFEANPPVDPVDITIALRDWALALDKPGTALLKDLTQAAFLIEFITKERAEAAALIRTLFSRVDAAERERKRLRDRIDLSLNNYLVEMRKGYDDLITGFNEAWDVVCSVFADMESNNAGK